MTFATECTLCGDQTNEHDGDYRDLGNDEKELVCPDCQTLADDIEEQGDSNDAEEVTTKYAI